MFCFTASQFLTTLLSGENNLCYWFRWDEEGLAVIWKNAPTPLLMVAHGSHVTLNGVNDRFEDEEKATVDATATHEVQGTETQGAHY